MQARLLGTLLLLAGAILAVLVAVRDEPATANAAGPLADSAPDGARPTALSAPAIARSEPTVAREAVADEPVGFAGVAVTRVEQRPVARRPAPPRERNAFLPVQVVSTTTGDVLPGARVFYRLGASRKPWRAAVPTGSGAFFAAGWTERRFPSQIDLKLLAVNLDGLVGRSETTLSGLYPGHNDGLVLSMDTVPERFFHAVLIDDRDLQPVAGARVKVRDASTERTRDWRLARRYSFDVDRSDERGRVELIVPPWDDLQLQVEATGYLPATFALPDGHRTASDPWIGRLVRDAQVRVRVVDADGRVVPGITVRLVGGDQEWEAVTDAEGVCTLNEVETGVTLEVELLRVDDLLAQDRASLILRADEPVQLELSLPR